MKEMEGTGKRFKFNFFKLFPKIIKRFIITLAMANEKRKLVIENAITRNLKIFSYYLQKGANSLKNDFTFFLNYKKHQQKLYENIIRINYIS